MAALRGAARQADADLVLDGEIVALREGQIVRFEALQGRMHIEKRGAIAPLARDEPAAYVAYDLLLIGREPLVTEPLTRRRAALETMLRGRQRSGCGWASAGTTRWRTFPARRASAPTRAGEAPFRERKRAETGLVAFPAAGLPAHPAAHRPAPILAVRW